MSESMRELKLRIEGLQLDQEEINELISYLSALDGKNIKVRDGFVSKKDMVWWWASRGPKLVAVNNSQHRYNIRNFPEYYSIKEPSYKIDYEE